MPHQGPHGRQEVGCAGMVCDCVREVRARRVGDGGARGRGRLAGAWSWTYCARIGGWSESQRESESSATPRGGRGWSEAGSRSTLERRGAPGRVWLAGWLARGSRCWAEPVQDATIPVQGLSRDRGAHRGTCVGPATCSVSEDVGRAGGRAPGWQPFTDASGARHIPPRPRGN